MDQPTESYTYPRHRLLTPPDGWYVARVDYRDGYLYEVEYELIDPPRNPWKLLKEWWKVL